MFEWIVTYVINLLVSLWIVKWGGAGWFSGWLFPMVYKELDADSVKWFGWFWLVMSTLLFLGGIFDADIRSALVDK